MQETRHRADDASSSGIFSCLFLFGQCVRNWRNWIKINSGVLTFLCWVLALVFLCELLVTYAMPALVPGFADQLLDALASAILLSILVLAVILPFLLRLNRRARIAEKAIASTNEGYWVLNSDGGFVDVNPGYCRMLGYTRPELMLMTIADLEAVATLPQIQAQIRRIIDKGHERFETRHRHRNGQWIDLEITVTGVDDRYLIAFLLDISERKATDLALREVTRIERSVGRQHRTACRSATQCLEQHHLVLQVSQPGLYQCLLHAKQRALRIQGFQLARSSIFQTQVRQPQAGGFTL